MWRIDDVLPQRNRIYTICTHELGESDEESDEDSHGKSDEESDEDSAKPKPKIVKDTIPAEVCLKIETISHEQCNCYVPCNTCVIVSIKGFYEPFRISAIEMMWLNADEMKTLGSVDEFVEFLDRRTRLPRIKADELDAAEFWKKNELEQRAMLLRELTSESDWNQYTSDRRMTANEHYAEMRAMRAFLDNVIEALRVPVSVS